MHPESKNRWAHLREITEEPPPESKNRCAHLRELTEEPPEEAFTTICFD
jgi:hypothetical protein